MESEWSKFKVGSLSDRHGWTNTDCQSFDTISHVAHIHVAKNIMCDGTIRSGLIFDKSKLNTERIQVSWLSPNDWHGAGGFRYGNVRYNYNFNSLIENKNYYWVESIAYGIEACRILITNEDRSDSLTPYDPTLRDGPWWYDSKKNTHYRNGNKCLEFMFEEDFAVADSTSLDFVDHSPDKCNICPKTCPDRGVSRTRAAFKFMAFLLSSTCALPRHLFTEKYKKKRFFNEDYLSHFATLRRLIIDNVVAFGKNINSSSDASDALIRAIFSAYADGHNDESYALAALFDSKSELEVAMESYCLSRFRIDELSLD